MAFVDQGLGGSTANWFTSSLTAAAVSSEGLTGSGGYISKTALSHGWQVSSGYWLEAGIPHHVGLSTGLFEQPHNMAFSSPRASGPRKSKADVSMSFVT